MEPRIIYQIENFISFLFGKNNYNDPEQRIYNKLIQLEGNELEAWINRKVKKYITGKDYYFEFEGEAFEGIKGPILFKHWYWDNIFKDTGKALSQQELFGTPLYKLISSNEEYKIIKDKIQIFKEKFVYYDRERKWGYVIFMDYLEMFIMTMSSEDLKNFIIQQVNPIK